ncbi:hypothetical protein J6590_006955 [Homalodisca vitripennis]|nr:hypothetical protein J6590_006955 [Homalodisca vitripennis]
MNMNLMKISSTSSRMVPQHIFTFLYDIIWGTQLCCQWIGRRGVIEWPARSPDLTPKNFGLCVCGISRINAAVKESKRKRPLPRSESPYLPPDGRYPILRSMCWCCVSYRHTTTDM